MHQISQTKMMGDFMEEKKKIRKTVNSRIKLIIKPPNPAFENVSD